MPGLRGQRQMDLLNLKVSSRSLLNTHAMSVTPCLLCTPQGRGENTPVGSHDSTICCSSQHVAESLIDQGHQIKTLEPDFLWYS